MSPEPGDVAGVERIEDTVRRYAQRVLQLEQLATDMLASFIPVSDGHRARVGQVQIGKWRAVLDGLHLPAPEHAVPDWFAGIPSPDGPDRNGAVDAADHVHTDAEGNL